jgi:Flp pilus assembly protein TadD
LKRLREEKASLEQANRELASQSAAAKSSAQTARRLGSSNTRAESADARRIRELEAQRDELQRMFSAVTRDLHDQKSRGQMQVAYAEQLTNQLAIFRARLQVLEAPKVPYSADEITLLRMPELKLPKSDGQNYLEPAGEVTAAAELAAEAGRAFNARRLDEAQKKYEQVLNMAKRNVGILGNLAAVQIQLNHLAEAEKTLRQALAESPKDAFSLSLLGVIRVRQKKYDEALESLSRSAQLDPKNAETHHYLGIVLAEKGLRAPAEAAFRRAIELSPGHAGAHHNLAVVYVTQKPPALELARWHYQKALAGGHTRNPELENALNGKRSTAAMK